MSNPFTAHPHSVNETYWEHFAFAFGFGVKMGIGALAAVVHAAFPFLFTATAGRISDELVEMRKQTPGRLKAAREVNTTGVSQ
jgi:hypothetical protein